MNLGHTSLTSVVPPKSSSVPLERLNQVDRLVDDDEADIESMNFIRNWTGTKKHVSSELDTGQGKGIRH